MTETVEFIQSHFMWIAGIVIAGGIVGITTKVNGATKKDAKFYGSITSVILLVTYLFIRFG